MTWYIGSYDVKSKHDSYKNYSDGEGKLYFLVCNDDYKFRYYLIKSSLNKGHFYQNLVGHETLTNGLGGIVHKCLSLTRSKIQQRSHSHNPRNMYIALQKKRNIVMEYNVI